MTQENKSKVLDSTKQKFVIKKALSSNITNEFFKTKNQNISIKDIEIFLNNNAVDIKTIANFSQNIKVSFPFLENQISKLGSLKTIEMILEKTISLEPTNYIYKNFYVEFKEDAMKDMPYRTGAFYIESERLKELSNINIYPENANLNIVCRFFTTTTLIFKQAAFIELQIKSGLPINNKSFVIKITEQNLTPSLNSKESGCFLQIPISKDTKIELIYLENDVLNIKELDFDYHQLKNEGKYLCASKIKKNFLVQLTGFQSEKDINTLIPKKIKKELENIATESMAKYEFQACKKFSTKDNNFSSKSFLISENKLKTHKENNSDSEDIHEGKSIYPKAKNTAEESANEHASDIINTNTNAQAGEMINDEVVETGKAMDLDSHI